MTRREPRSRSTRAAPSAPERMVEPRSQRVASWLVIALLVVTPLVMTTDTKESFRTVKGLVAAWLGLASLLACSWRLRDLDHVPWRAALEAPALRAVLPLLTVVLAGAVTTRHPAHFRDAAADLAIGALCLAGWSLALPAAVLQRALTWSLGVSVIVAALAIDQAWGLVGILDGLGVLAPTERLAITSTLGNPGDVGASLILPLLLAAWRWPRSQGTSRRLLTVALLVMTAGLLVTATLAAGLAVLAGGFMLVALHPADDRPRRRGLAIAGVVVLVAVAAMAVGPVRARVSRVTAALQAGDLNTVLTGRLDGWRVAAALTREHPWTGVGQGGFVAEYARMKLRLVEAGVPFYREQTQVMFDTPHNEYLSVAAEQGWPGVVALAWGIVVLTVHAWRRRGGERAMAWGGLVGLGVLALAWFPMHVAAVAWPWLVFLAWMGQREPEA